MKDFNPDFQKEIIKMNGESFDEGAKAAMESLTFALDKLLELQPNLSGKEVIDVIKYWKEQKYI